jgi:hypothetical protein
MEAKLQITYDPNDIDDVCKINRMLHADGCYSTLHEMNTYLRGKIKYSEDDKEIDFAEKVREELQNSLYLNGVDLDNDWR